MISDSANGWYIGGSFTNAGGFTRNRIAHILADGTVDPSWNPNANSTVNSIAVSGSTVYAGGSFSTMGIESRNRFAAIDVVTGSTTGWWYCITWFCDNKSINQRTVYAYNYAGLHPV